MSRFSDGGRWYVMTSLVYGTGRYGPFGFLADAIRTADRLAYGGGGPVVHDEDGFVVYRTPDHLRDDYDHGR